MSERLDPSTALLLIDLQRAIDDPRWGRRNNPQLEANLARLLAAWRQRGMPVVHVRHASTEPGSTYAPDGSGYAFKPEVEPREGEWIITKRVHSAFIGTELAARLERDNIGRLVIAGVITNNSVEATARMAGNLGYDTTVVSDATATFDKRDHDGRLRSAEEVHALSLANLDGEYAAIATTDALLAQLR